MLECYRHPITIEFMRCDICLVGDVAGHVRVRSYTPRYFRISIAQTSGNRVCRKLVSFCAFCACCGEQFRQLRKITSGRAAARNTWRGGRERKRSGFYAHDIRGERFIRFIIILKHLQWILNDLKTMVEGTRCVGKYMRLWFTAHGLKNQRKLCNLIYANGSNNFKRKIHLAIKCSDVVYRIIVLHFSSFYCLGWKRTIQKWYEMIMQAKLTNKCAYTQKYYHRKKRSSWHHYCIGKVCTDTMMSPHVNRCARVHRFNISTRQLHTVDISVLTLKRFQTVAHKVRGIYYEGGVSLCR